MNRIKYLSLAVMFLLAFSGQGQSVGEIEMKGGGRSSGGFAEKKLKKAPKQVYIAEFRINYQLLYTDQESTQATSTMGGGYRGGSSASLSVGVQSVKPSDLIELTDKMYADYVAGLKKQGYSIISPDEAGKTAAYEGWERVKGGTLSQAQVLGFTTVSPTDYEYFVKRTTAKGKEKSSFTDNSHKLSFEMDNALIVKVNLTIPFMEDAESQGSKALTKAIGGVSKVVAAPDFKISEKSQASYIYATNKFGPEAVALSKLDKELKIEGVFEDKKYKAVSSASSDQNWSNSAFVTVYDNATSFVQVAACDASKYKTGVLTAGGKFLSASLGQLQEYSGGK